MSDPVLERPLVRQYLRDLDAACAILPVAQAQELHEQIAAHLEEALSPGASIAEVTAELARLGPPRSLAAAAAGPSRFLVLRKLRNRARRVRWWVWTAIAVVVTALGTGAGFLISMNSTTPLYVLGTGWLYPADQAHAVDTSAGLIRQTTVPVRSGQRQGITFGVWNGSDWTQVILGTDPRWYEFGFTDIQVTVQSGPHLNDVDTTGSGTSYYASPGVIPPHSYRYVHLTWTSNVCLAKGGYTWFGDVPLRVQVGVITRTEDIALDQETFALEGPSHGKCD
jgi:hypothetical protein